MSCDVATLARDIKVLAASGFAVASLEGFDLFPNTAHVETLAVLVRCAVRTRLERSARLAAARKPRNRPWNRPLSQKLSGCHCTATQKRDAGRSTASMTPSTELAVTFRPSPTFFSA